MESREELTNSNHQALIKRRALKLMGIPDYLTYSQIAGLAQTQATPLEVTPVPEPDQELTDKSAQKADQKADQKPAQKAEPEAEPAIDPQTDPHPAEDLKRSTISPIRFDWIKGVSGILCVDQISRDRLIALQDVVGYLDWRHGKVETRPNKFTQDIFQWPQLTATDTGPARPLAVFFEKHAREPQWIVVDRYVADNVLIHMPDKSYPKLIVLDDLGAALTDPQSKLALWQTLAK